MSIDDIDKPASGDNPSDYTSKITDSFDAIDAHDHSAGKGAPAERVHADSMDQVTLTTNASNQAQVVTGSIKNTHLGSTVVDGSTMDLDGSSKIEVSGATGPKKAAKTLTTDGSDPGAGGVSMATGGDTTISGLMTLTDSDTIITTLGNPVLIFAQQQSDSSSDANTSSFEMTDAGDNEVALELTLERDTDGGGFNVIARVYFRMKSTLMFGHSIPFTFPANLVKHLDTPAAGTHTYRLSGLEDWGNTVAKNISLVAWELA